MTVDVDDRLGVDFACIDDLDASLSLVDGQTALAQHVARRITSPRGGLFHDVDYGTDARSVLHGAVTLSPTQSARMIEAEAMKDPRVASAAADVSWDQNSETLTVEVRIEDDQGDNFDLTVSIDDLTVELLEG